MLLMKGGMYWICDNEELFQVGQEYFSSNRSIRRGQERMECDCSKEGGILEEIEESCNRNYIVWVALKAERREAPQILPR